MKTRSDPHIIKTGDNPHAEAQLQRMVDSECVATKGFSMSVTIDNPITVAKAAEITGLKPARVQQLCREFQKTKGASGLKSKKFGRDWQIEKEAAEAYERTNRGPKPETN